MWLVLVPKVLESGYSRVGSFKHGGRMGMVNRLVGFSFVGELQGRGRHLSGRIYALVYTGSLLT